MVFPGGGPLPRHPSQLYQAALEGLLLFITLWWFSAKARPRAAVSGLFLLGYGVFRFIVEFVRIPDPQYGYLAFNWLTMGQVLCLPMIIGGAVMMVWAYRRAN
jgi:phosphatidylglycerol:prolipoprotein diacylglycerol transferase